MLLNSLKAFKIGFLRNILTAALLVCIIMPATAILFIYPAFKQLLINNTEREASVLASHLMHENIGRQEAVLPGSLTPLEEQRLSSIAEEFGLAKLKIFSRSGQVVYSTDARDLGNLNRERYFQGIVARGKVFSKIVQRGTPTMEGHRLKVDVAEIYVPIMHDSEFAGAFEIYLDITSRIRRLDRLLMHSTVLLSLTAAGLLSIIVFSSIKAGREMAAREKAEKSLRKSEATYRSMMTAMKDPVYICSPDFRIEFMNPAMRQRVGYEATGDICHKAINGLNRQCPFCVHHKVQQGENADSEIVSPKDGRSYLVSHSPIVCDDGRISKMTIYKDITYIKQMQEALVKAKKMELLGLMSRGIAHEFNNIFASVIGFTELATDDAERGSLQESNLQEVLTVSQRAKTLLEKICLISQPPKADFAPVQAGEVIEKAVYKATADIPKGIRVRLILDSHALIRVDPPELRLIMDILCNNALEAMQKEGGVLTVTFGCRTQSSQEIPVAPEAMQGRYVELSVKDTGVGIAQQDLPRIFDPFFSTKAPGQGTGLGLAMVQSLVECYGGKIHATSRLGKGTTITVLWPALGMAAGQAA